MNNVSVSRVELLQGSEVEQHHLLSTATLLTCNNATLAAKTLFFNTLFCFKSVTKYFAQPILVTQLRTRNTDFLTILGSCN